MAFLDQLKDTAMAAAERTKVIAKTVSEKAEAALEIQKLSHAVNRQEQIISDSYKKIGEYTYQQLHDATDIPEELAESFTAVTEAIAEIDKLNKEIAQIKMEQFGGPVPTIICPQCGESISEAAKFCPQCGNPIFTAKAAEPAAETPAEEAPAQAAPVEEAAEPVAEEAPAEAAPEPAEETPAEATSAEEQPPTEPK